MRRVPTVIVLVALASSAGGCFTPSVPVPPPGPESFNFSITTQTCDPMDPPSICDPTATVATFSAGPDIDWADSWVVVRDEHHSDGVVTRTNPDGSVSETMPFRADAGDQINIGYERDSDHQQIGICMVLHAGQGSSSDLCP